jgi:hypothetical protein
VEVVPATRRQLLSVDAVRGYVGGDGVFKNELFEHVDGRGTRKVVVRHDGGWRLPDSIQTVRFPLVAVDCWADCSRADDGEIMQRDAVDNAWAVWNAVDPAMNHRRNEFWGAIGVNQGLYVMQSWLWGEPLEQTRNESHQGSFQGVRIGDAAVVTARYALIVG